MFPHGLRSQHFFVHVDIVLLHIPRRLVIAAVLEKIYESWTDFTEKSVEIFLKVVIIKSTDLDCKVLKSSLNGVLVHVRTSG